MATLLILAVSIAGNAEAGIITDRLPFYCYVDHQVDTYEQPNGRKIGYISANVDLIRVTNVRSDGWAYGDYPISGGRRISRWFRVSELCADPGYSNRGTRVQGAQRVFNTQNSNEPFGSVSHNEEVIVLADNGNRAQIIYKLNNNTGYKVGWVPSSSVSSRTSPGPIPNPISNTAHLNDGWYRIQPMHDLGRSVDALGPQIGSGNNIHMWTSVDSALQQKFYLRNQGNGYFTLQSAYGSKLYVTADGRGPGANLYTAPQNNSDSQLFRVVDAGNNSYHVFAKIGVNLNFDCAGGGRGDGNNVQLWTTENNDWHKWRFTPVNLDSVDHSREGIQKRLMQAVFHTTNGVRISKGGDFDGYIELKKNYGYIHEGIDLVLYHKAPVYAVISGTIVRAGDGYGNTVAIYNEEINKTIVYLHFDSVASDIYVGTKVNKNTLIGYQGNKDAPQGSHVHIEIRNGKQNGAAKSSDQHQDNPNPYPYWDQLLQ